MKWQKQPLGPACLEVTASRAQMLPPTRSNDHPPRTLEGICPMLGEARGGRLSEHEAELVTPRGDAAMTLAPLANVS